MKKAEKMLLTNSEITFMVFGSAVGVGILSLPNSAVKFANEDAWIAVIAGGIYPIYMMFIAGYISKKSPNKNILYLSKRYFGKIIGSVLNIIFAFSFLFLVMCVAAGYSNITRSFIINFLSPIKVIVVIFIMVLYTSMKSIKTLAKINSIIFYITLIIFLSPIPALKTGSILNVMPLFKSDIKSFVNTIATTGFSYAGIEIIFIIYPFAKEKDKIFKSSLLGSILVILLYAWVTFITIYYLGADIVNKSYWSFLTVSESVTVSVINNFRYIVMFIWSLCVFKVLSSDYHIGVTILQDVFKKINPNIMFYVLTPIMIYLSLKMGNMVNAEIIVEKYSGLFIVFNLIFVTLIAAIMFIKKDEVI